MIDFNKERRYKSTILILIILALILTYLLFSFPKEDTEPMLFDEPVSTKDLNKFTVSSGSKESAEVATRVLSDGGNAIDAAIALNFALAVTAPQSNGLGGGGVMLVYDSKSKESTYYDFYNSSGLDRTNNHIGIPGFLNGMEFIYNDYATKSLDYLIAPAIKLAEEGVIVSDKLSLALENAPFIADMNEAFLNHGEIVKAGDLLVQNELAETLKSVQNEGFNILYDGTHKVSMDFMKASGYNQQSLLSYKTNKYKAINTTFNEEIIIGAGSPFSGSTAIQFYKLLRNSSILLNEQTLKSSEDTYKDIYNFTYLQNKDFVGDTVESRLEDHKIVEDEYLNNFNIKNLKYDEDFNESENTISYTIIDQNGLIVAGTNTLSNEWGSTLSDNGIIYNNSLKNFSSASNNTWAPMKRPKTLISPLIIDKGNENYIAISAAGGNSIPQVISTILTISMEDDSSLHDAMNTQRFYRNKNRYYIEDEKSRDYNLFSNMKLRKDIYYLKKDRYFSSVTISELDNGVYRSYFDDLVCDNKCIYPIDN